MSWLRDGPASDGRAAVPAPHGATLTGMETLSNVFVGLHIVGIAALLGGFLAQTRAIGAGEARFTPGMLHGALTMLVTGLVLVGLAEARDEEVNNLKIGVKLAVLVVILGLVYVKRDEERLPAGVFGAVGALTTVNIFLAVLWV